jgi:hypothetical protein
MENDTEQESQIDVASQQDTENQKPAEDQPEPQTNKAYKYITGFVIAVALLIFLISAVILVVQIVPDTIKLIAGISQSITTDEGETPEEESISPLSADDSFVRIGEPVTISWSDTRDQEEGVYSLLLLCDDEEVDIEHKDAFYSCGDSLFFEPGEEQAKISILSSTKRYVNIPIILEFENDEGIETIDEIELTIANDDPDLGVVLGTNTDDDTVVIDKEDSSDNSISDTSNFTTTPTRDLAVQMLQAGPMVNGVIVSNASSDLGSVAVIRFEIRNNGNVSTGPWSFQAVLPLADISSRVFNSGLQNSLSPGSGVIYTLTFSGLREGTNQALVNVDPTNIVSETYEGNNQASATFYVSGSSNFSTGNGDADFDIDLISIGRLSGSRFIETDNLDVDDELAIQFRVTNIGGEETEDWRFEVDVDEPSRADDLDYRSQRYDALLPGEHRTITISFDGLEEDGDYDFDIEVDPDKDTNEDHRSNNRLRFDVDIDN